MPKTAGSRFAGSRVRHDKSLSRRSAQREGGWKHLIAALLVAFAAGRGVAAAQSTHLAVIVGLAGDPEFSELYGKWGASLVDTLLPLEIQRG